jgi:hypothetical protein
MDSQQGNVSRCSGGASAYSETDGHATIQLARNEDCDNRRDIVSLHIALEHGAIACLAYRCWQERGSPEGSATADWFRAERELRNKTEFASPEYYDGGPVLRLPH